MLVVHGGSWFSVGQGGVAAMRADADRWRARGWRTLNVTYRACAQSLGDVQWFYDRARKLWGDALPYCALGASAGGHLALELAASRNGLYCVIAQAGVTDAAGLLAGGEGPRRLYNTMLSAFGPDNLTALSPARNPGALAATRVLYVAATADPVVPAAQGDALQQGIRGANPNAYVDVLGLPDGDVQWVHRAVSSAGLGEYFAREAKLVAPLG
jgi:acetyl esterase/lipase